MTAPQNIIAVIFDFDDTLTDESTTKLLEKYGVDPVEFWQKQNGDLITEQGWDPVPAYLKLLLDHVGEGKPFGRLTNRDLREFGATLTFYPGVATVFRDLRGVAKRHTVSNPAVEFYVISSGLEEIVLGSKIAKELSGVWGCQFAEGPEGTIQYIKNIVSFTEKTRYIFEINKGIRNSRSKPYAVNEEVAAENRRIPLENMICVGDGLTDVPCFSLLQNSKGKAFGVFDPTRKGSPKKAWEKLVAPRRVSTLNSPRYGKMHDLGSLLRMAVEQICLSLDVKTRSAIKSS